MKILKILLVLLVPAVGIVGCQKTCRKPASPMNATTAVAPENTSDNVAPAITAGRAAAPAVTMEDVTPPSDDNAAKFSNPTELDPTDNSTEVIGYGDDDRDGGNKKRKK